ncbi:uncharacterized protein GGS22DRAFT_192346 [Annulohypoxylon maeteangense]|uniref:uncharacterized protein n=1 Tax=Annulohypoxylon maeteangense TaxID=1927788 RepID=UPI002008963C|nr:uncharacterized protein GGS22DRAFT_192346 [Annulohypoxylon maeteangense]KAI0881259.1 hypothetical protein GGS22DRAFT_192346 [Annulohypoxylon maeteangense]
MSLMLCFRQLTRCFIKASIPFSWEDLLVLVSFAFASGESVITVIPGSEIYGKEISMITTQELRQGNKLGLARDLLFILSIGFSKLSVYLNLIALSPSATHRRMTHSLGGLVVIWMATSLIGTGFKHPDIMSCNSNIGGGHLGQQEFLTYVAVMNIITDFILIAIPIWIISPLHMALNFRVVLVSFYIIRVLFVSHPFTEIKPRPDLRKRHSSYDLPAGLPPSPIRRRSHIAVLPLLLMRSDTQFPLTKLSHQTFEKSESTKRTTGSQIQDRSNYVEITTDIAVSRGGHGEQPLSTADIYNSSWER